VATVTLSDQKKNLILKVNLASKLMQQQHAINLEGKWIFYNADYLSDSK